ncbi:MAG: glycerol-3-phosphate dehydrogenase/oxidase [Bacteroidetes bacterium]|nr:glycerol-3-phosphate dehydrogenase/oxidase [Bacteroidota bacterium]
MNRSKLIQQFESTAEFDIAIIGGGATGLGTAVDAASRGLKTILFEQYDFAKGTSSRSTKLVHGGVRYLQQGNVKLVMEALRERGLLLKNAPHLVKNQRFVVPNYKWWETPFYGIGLKIYDWMAGKLGLGSSRFLSAEETIELAPTLDPENLKGGILYHDGQFDDARLAINLAQTAVRENAIVLNYFAVTTLIKDQQTITGLNVTDRLSNKSFTVKSKVIINATGVFTDSVMMMDDPSHEKIISPSQGIHLVVEKDFLPGDTAIMIPHTDDGRVLFAVPWHNKIILGTTDTPVTTISPEPMAHEDEINFILTHIGRYLTKDPQRKDVLSVFAGLRPLVKGNSKTTAALTRDHLVTVSESGLITVTGGKWTTYRQMAEDTVNVAVEKKKLDAKDCITKSLMLYGFDKPVPPADISLLNDEEMEAVVQNSINEEMCMTVEDLLSRRTRTLLLNAKAAINMAPKLAEMMAKINGKDDQWVQQQTEEFYNVAKKYLPSV